MLLAASAAFLSACASESLDDARNGQTDATRTTAAPRFSAAPFGQFSKVTRDVQQLPQGETPRHVPGRLLMKLRQPLADATRLAAPTLLSAARKRLRALSAAGIELESVAELGSSSPARRAQLSPASLARRSGRYLLTLKSGAALADVVTRLRHDPNVEWVELDGIYDWFATPNDPNYSAQSHLPMIGAPEAWRRTSGSRLAKVAVLDSGVDWTHPDLAANIWSNPDEIAGDGLDNDDNGFVDDVRGWDFVSVDASQLPPGEDAGPPDNDPSDFVGHGTHVAGIIGATGNNGVGVSGVAWNVSIIPVRTGTSAGLELSTIVAALDYAVDNGADVINMSFGGETSSRALLEALQDAHESGVLLVAAAGNAGSRTRQFPAAHPNVLAVAALDTAGERAFFSSFGNWVDIAAPGSNVLSTLPGGNYGTASGTSMATPVVSGVAALLRSAHPQWSAGALARQLLSTANGVDASNPFHSGLLGAGRVNAAAGVGARAGAPSLRVASTVFQETEGDGDGELLAGETATLRVSVRGYSDPAAATLSLSTDSPWLAVTCARASLAAVPFDRSLVGELAVRVLDGVPANHRANLTLTLQSGAFQQQVPLELLLAPNVRKSEKLPPLVSSNLLTLPSGRMALISDDVTPTRWSVYASVRSANGEFSPIITLSNLASDAGAPIARTDAVGNVHVVFRQWDAEHAIASLYYAKFSDASNTWSPAERVTDEQASVFWFLVQNREGIGVDALGQPHVVWLDFRTGVGELRTRMRTDSGWQEQTAATLPSGVHYAWMDLLLLPSGRLGLFYTFNGTGNRDQPLRLVEWDGAQWVVDRELGKVEANDRHAEPFRFGDDFYQFYGGLWGTGPIQLGKLVGDQWSFERQVLDAQSQSFDAEMAFKMTALDRFLAVSGGSSNPLTLGSRRTLIRVDGTSETRSELPGSAYDVALEPVIGVDGDRKNHILTSEYKLQIVSFGLFLSNDHSMYYSDAPAPARLVPSLPIVTDEGASTGNATAIHASWASTHPTGIRSYDVAVGTAPLSDDVLPWSAQAGSQATLSLAETPLEPGQTYYVSVQSASNAIYRSLLGHSNGITYSGLPRCVAPVWKNVIAYTEAGIEVTYQGNRYRSLYFNSDSLPGKQHGAWQLVGACSGVPNARRCSAAAWNAALTYPVDLVVNHNGSEFVSQYASRGRTPTGAVGNPWKWISDCSG
jgi:subtilisin family serine protease